MGEEAKAYTARRGNRFVDETGNRHGRLVVLREAGRQHREVMWVCRCDCGAEVTVRGAQMRHGKSASCGCLRAIRASATHGTHRLKQTPEYKTWCGIKNRCKHPYMKSYKYYGGRGIRMCDRWANSFEAFLADMGTKPTPQHSIDRIDNDKGYEPGNCRWATAHEQVMNRRITSRANADARAALEPR